MKALLRLYDFLSHHRVVMVGAMALCFVLCVLLALRLRYKENVADFLPVDADNARYSDIYNALGGQNRTTLVFAPAGDAAASHDDLMDAADDFEGRLAAVVEEECNGWQLQFRVDYGGVWEALDFVSDNVPLFLTDADYRRADSLLAVPHYVDDALANVRQLLSQPSGSMTADVLQNDPLALFTPASQRLQTLQGGSTFRVVDDYLFDSGEQRLLAFLTTDYEATDTKSYAHLAEVVDAVADSVKADFPSVSVSAVGAGLVAATNAAQIKHDSFLAIALAVVLIALVLIVGVARRQNIFWLGLSLVFGWLFALGVVALFRPSISIIVIGVASVLVGIAVNYPLHFIDHLKDHPDARETLRDMMEPLVVGNVTTVSAFACLLFVRAEAMHDLGLFASLMLVGTIVFVMVFLPHLAKGGRTVSQGSRPAVCGWHQCKVWVLHLCASPWLFCVVVVLTVAFAMLSRRTSFDADLSHINYMTEEQRQGFALLSQAAVSDTASERLYVVAVGASVDEALTNNARLSSSSYALSGVGALLPAPEVQQQRLRQWDAFVHRHAGLADTVRRAAAAEGFADAAFVPFFDRLSAHYEVLPFGTMKPLLALAGDYILHSDTAVYVVNMLSVPADGLAEAKASLRAASDAVVFDNADVGSRLVSALSDDFDYILYVCGFVVFVFLCLSFRSLELSLLAFLPLTVGWFWILGIMAVADIRFNIVNIILATFIFGQGDDYTIFITEGLVDEYAYGKKRLQGFRRSVILSATLMFVGMAVLVVARHPAMRSLAEVAMVGMAVVLFMACYLPPVLFRWMTFHHGRQRLVPVTLFRLLLTLLSLLLYGCFTLFVFTPFTLCYSLIGRNGDKKRLCYHRMLCRCNKIAMRLLPGVHYRFDNGVGEDFSRPAVVVANHQSYLDLICVLMLHPRLVVLTNDWVWHNPLYGVVIRYAEFCPVQQGYEACLPKLRQLVARGYSVVVFPEGTRSVDGSIGRFHQGAFALAHALHLDVLPLFIHGAGDVMPKDDIVLRKGRITVEVGRRVAVGTDALCEARRMRAVFVEHYAAMRQRLEDEDYWTPFVDAQYCYKGRSASRHRPGREALLRALSHPDEVVRWTAADDDEYRLLSHFVLRPNNLILLPPKKITAADVANTR